MTDRITLKIEGGSWQATWHGSEVRRIRSLMGTATLPTPYTDQMPGEKVRKMIAHLNPGHIVELA